MQPPAFAAITSDIAENTEDDVDLHFLLPTGKVTGMWQWLPGSEGDVIIVSGVDTPPTYIAVEHILAVQVVSK